LWSSGPTVQQLGAACGGLGRSCDVGVPSGFDSWIFLEAASDVEQAMLDADIAVGASELTPAATFAG
jgi:hypothetical protein